MDFLSFVFTPQGIVNLYAGLVATGATVGILVVAFSLMDGRQS